MASVLKSSDPLASSLGCAVTSPIALELVSVCPIATGLSALLALPPAANPVAWAASAAAAAAAPAAAAVPDELDWPAGPGGCCCAKAYVLKCGLDRTRSARTLDLLATDVGEETGRDVGSPAAASPAASPVPPRDAAGSVAPAKLGVPAAISLLSLSFLRVISRSCCSLTASLCSLSSRAGWQTTLGFDAYRSRRAAACCFCCATAAFPVVPMDGPPALPTRGIWLCVTAADDFEDLLPDLLLDLPEEDLPEDLTPYGPPTASVMPAPAPATPAPPLSVPSSYPSPSGQKL